LALPHYTAQQQSLLPILNSGGTTQTTTMFVPVPIVPAIVSFSPASGIRGSNADIIGTFDYVNGGSIKVGNETAAVVSVNQALGRIVFTIPNGVNSGNGNLSSAPNLITYTSLGGSSTSGTPFTVTEPANTTITVHYHVYVGNRSGSAGAYIYEDWPMTSPTTSTLFNLFQVDTEVILNGVPQGYSDISSAKVYMRSPTSAHAGLTQNQINGNGPTPNTAATVFVNGLSYDGGWVSGTFTMLKTDRFKILRWSSSTNAAANISDSVWLTDTQIYRRNYLSGQVAYSAPYTVGLGNAPPYSAQVSNGYIYFTEEQLSGKTIHIWSGAKSAY